MEEVINEIKEKLKGQDLSRSEWLVLFIDMGLIKVNQVNNQGTIKTEYNLNNELYPNAVNLILDLTKPKIETGSDSGFQ